MWHKLSLWWFYAGLVAVLLVVDLLVFTLAARRARGLAAHGETTQAIRLLKWVVRLPSIRGEATKLEMRYVLGVCLGEQRLFADAAVQWQKILRYLSSYGWKNLRGLEAEVRIYLADCLEGMGWLEEAKQEREMAQSSLPGRTPTVRSLLAQADLLKAQGKHSEAYAALEQSLSLVSPKNKVQQMDCLMRLMHASLSTGRPDLTVQWAERGLEQAATEPDRIACLRMAGFGHCEQGALDDAERCCRQAQTLAVSTHNVKEENAARVLLASVLQKKGKPAEAIEMCRNIPAAEPMLIRPAHTVWSECLRDLGRFEEAQDILRQARNAPGSGTPSAERRAQSVLALHMAVIASMGEQPAEAFAFLREAAPELSRDEKLGMWVSALGARIYAQLGQPEEGEVQTNAVLRALPRFAHDRMTLKLVYAALARAAFSRADWTRSQELWTLYFAQKPNPNGLPVGYYYQGECALALGDEAGAQAAFQNAQTVNPEMYYARLARRRLDEMMP